MARKRPFRVSVSDPGVIQAPPEAIAKLQEEMVKKEFRELLIQDVENALDQVGIRVDANTLEAIQNHLAGRKQIRKNSLICVGGV
jgi:hypothetical protein